MAWPRESKCCTPRSRGRDVSQDSGGQAQSGTVTFKPLGVYDVDKVRVRVEVDAMCQIALVNRIVCDTPHIGGLSSLLILTRKVRAEAVYPYQGALYEQIKK